MKCTIFRFSLIQILIAFTCVTLVIGQTNQVGVLAKQHLYPFSYQGSFQGPGWDSLVNHARSHHHFLIGEDHGLAEVPLFASALFAEQKVDVLVTEIDSIAASVAQYVTLLTSTAVDSFHQRNPAALSFYSAREEFHFLQELTSSGADVWGLDQVSLFSTGIAFDRLSDLCTSEQAIDVAKSLAKQSDEAFQEAARTGNYELLFIFAAKAEIFDELRVLLSNESQEAKRIASNIEISWKIYNRIDQATYHTRIGEMKSAFLNYYFDNQGKSDRRLLYKFGAYHVSKAESLIGGHDVGNLVANIAHAEGKKSYHLMIVGKKGGMNTFLPTEEMSEVTYAIEDETSPLHALTPFAQHINERWGFFDLRAIRSQVRQSKVDMGNTFLERLIKGYDGLVIIPETTASGTY